MKRGVRLFFVAVVLAVALLPLAGVALSQEQDPYPPEAPRGGTEIFDGGDEGGLGGGGGEEEGLTAREIIFYGAVTVGAVGTVWLIKVALSR